MQRQAPITASCQSWHARQRALLPRDSAEVGHGDDIEIASADAEQILPSAAFTDGSSRHPGGVLTLVISLLGISKLFSDTMPVYSLTGNSYTVFSTVALLRLTMFAVPAASPFIQYEGVQWSFNNEAIFLNPSSTNTTLSIGVQFVGSEVSITGEPLPHFANVSSNFGMLALTERLILALQLSYSGSLDSQAIQPVQTQFNLRTPMRDLGPGPHDLRLNVLGAQQYVVSNITITAGDADPR
jgi:hypothetical protein